ncbi:MAG: tRNA 2-thiouridine(34) synthase MnmA [Candidatus Gracilibacteria bacterium]
MEIESKQPNSKASLQRGRRKVFVGMSGGVDSSVAAFLLSSGGGSLPVRQAGAFGGKKEGYDVTGVFINGFNVDGCSERDAEDARRVADHLGIPFYVIDAREDYFEYVVQYMIKGYKEGLTPNPDVMCNKEIKFGIFLDKALKLGADYIATGHYIRLRRNDEFPISNFQINSKLQIKNDENFEKIFSLLEAKDLNKDQSYFLWTLTQEQLKHCLFPIGEYTKPEVREIAKKAKLPTAEKKDSQGICFLGKVKLPEFLKEYIKPKKGDVLDTEGYKIGEHEGAQFYTIGQRHINIQHTTHNKRQGTNQRPYYVAEKDIKKNVLIAAEGDTHPALFKKEITLTDVHFINEENHSLIRANRRIEVLVRVRYRQPLVRAMLVIGNKESVTSKGRKLPVTSYQLLFSEPIKFIAPGQSAVFYSIDVDKNGNHEMLGGGIIL